MALDQGSYAPGDRIVLETRPHVELWAAFLLLLVPVILMISGTLTLVALGTGEALGGVGGLALAGTYYFVVRLLEPRTREYFRFRVSDKYDQPNNI